MAWCTCKMAHCLGGISTEPDSVTRECSKNPALAPGDCLESVPASWDQPYKLHAALSCICHYQRGFLAWWTGADRNKTMLMGLSRKYYGQHRHVERVSSTSERKVQNKSNESRKIPRQEMTSSVLSNNRKHSSYLQLTNHQGNLKKNLLLTTEL